MFTWFLIFALIIAIATGLIAFTAKGLAFIEIVKETAKWIWDKITSPKNEN